MLFAPIARADLSRNPDIGEPLSSILIHTLERSLTMDEKQKPEPSDLAAFKEIVGGKIVDLSTLRRLAECELVEDINGTTVLTDTGVEVAMKMSSAI
jgi:hypothetical protein